MATKVKLSKDGSSIDFQTTEAIPTTAKKFRKSPEIEGFYRFVYENDLQREAYVQMVKISSQRKIDKANRKKAKRAK